jgi:hypothetical protein
MSCGKRHLDAPGVLTSPRYPTTYPSSTDCQWTISTTTGKIITLQFSVFAVSFHDLMLCINLDFPLKQRTRTCMTCNYMRNYCDFFWIFGLPHNIRIPTFLSIGKDCELKHFFIPSIRSGFNFLHILISFFKNWLQSVIFVIIWTLKYSLVLSLFHPMAMMSVS